MKLKIKVLTNRALVQFLSGPFDLRCRRNKVMIIIYLNNMILNIKIFKSHDTETLLFCFPSKQILLLRDSFIHLVVSLASSLKIQ